MSSSKQCVLAYSGGLDTSAIVVWLRERGYEVHAVLVDVGQQEDLPALRDKALALGAATAVIRDARPAMFASVIPIAIGVAATYEGSYRLGTALARPFIAREQVRVARRLGGATLVHGATGKGNDQIRFEYAYRSLAPECPVLAPWKCWELRGRQDLVDYLIGKGYAGDYETTREYSFDENLWHLSVEGGPLEKPDGALDVERVLRAVADRFAGGATRTPAPSSARVTFERGVPVAVNGRVLGLPETVALLNRQFRSAAWAWDLVIENRVTGIKSRGLYLNPAAKLLHRAVDGLARTILNKPLYDHYIELGRQYGAMLYRGEYFSDQRAMLEAAAREVMKRLSGTVSVQLAPVPYVSRIDAGAAIFRHDLATFEKSSFSHHDAEGFIRLSWLSAVGRPCGEDEDADTLEAADSAPSDVCASEPLSARGLVPTGV